MLTITNSFEHRLSIDMENVARSRRLSGSSYGSFESIGLLLFTRSECK